MIIEQISANAYACTNIIEDWAVMYKTTELFAQFVPDETRLPADGAEYSSPIVGARREVRRVTEYVYKQQVLDTVRRNVEHLLPTEAIQAGFEIWRDYPGFRQALHQDQAPVNTVFIAYFGTAPNMGTRWIENDQEYSIPYEFNTGLLLRNSDRIRHSMAGVVAGVDYRRSLYINWILTAQ